MLDKLFSVERARKNLGEIYLEDGVTPFLQQTFQCWKSLLQFFHLHVCDIDLRNKIVEKRFFWEQGLPLFFCFAVCFDSRYSVNDSTARSICWNGVQQLGVFVGASKCFSYKVGNALHYSLCGAVFTRAAMQAISYRHNLFFWKMAVDVKVVGVYWEPFQGSQLCPGARFSKFPVTFRARNQILKSKYKE